MKIEDVLAMWKTDCVIDDLNLDEATKHVATIHAKYVELLTQTKIELKRRELEQKVLLRDKWLHFNGKLDKAKIDEYGWKYDPFDGLKILKSDMAYFFEADPELQKSERRIEYIKTLKETLSDIVETIKWRHQSIRNILEFKKFTSGA
jgi:hypothetical protein